MNTSKTTKADQALHADIMALCKRHLTPDTKERVLAVAAMVVGQVIAMQDQRTMTWPKAMEIVMKNIEIGNIHVINSLKDIKGTMQ